MCDCGKDCKIPVGKIGPQGPDGEQGIQGIQGVKGLDSDEIPFVWIPIPLENLYTAGAVIPEYSIRNGFLYMRGIVFRGKTSNAPFTYQDFGFTKTVLTSCGDDRSQFSNSDFTIEKLIFSAGNLGVSPHFIVPHTLLLDSMAPLSIQ